MTRLLFTAQGLQMSRGWQSSTTSRPPLRAAVLCYILRVQRGSGPVLSAHTAPSFHPTVLLEKALSAASKPAVSGSGVRADPLRGRGAPVQSVIKHTAHLADPAPPSVPSAGLSPPRLPEIKHEAAVTLVLCYQPGCLITSTRRAKQ